MLERLSIVVDGDDRWRAAATAAVRDEVIAEHAAALQNANFWTRWWITLQIERKVVRRMRDVPKPSREALF